MVCTKIVTTPQVVVIQTRNALVFSPGIPERFAIEKPRDFVGDIELAYMRGLGAAPFQDLETDGRVVFEKEETETCWTFNFKIQDSLAGVVSELG